MANPTELNDSTRFLVEWASRIEMEFMSFKSIVSDALKGRFETIETNLNLNQPLPPSLSTNHQQGMQGMQAALASLNVSVEKLTQKVGSLEQKLSSIHLVGDLQSNDLHINISSDIENLRLLQDQLIRSLTTQSLAFKSSAVGAKDTSHSSDIEDIKYFLKLILPRIMNIEAQCNAIIDSTGRLQKRKYAAAFDFERNSGRAPHSRLPSISPSMSPSRSPYRPRPQSGPPSDGGPLTGLQPSTPPRKLLHSNFYTSTSRDLLN